MVITLADLKRQVRVRCNMQNSNFIDDTGLTDFINQSYQALYDFVVLAWEDYFLSSFQFTLTGTQDGYAVPDAVYKLRGIDVQMSGANSWGTVKRYDHNERNQFISPWAVMSRSLYPSVMYRWAGPTLQFIPQQHAAGTYQFWYIPTLTLLVNDTDPMQASMTKFAEYIVVDSAIKCLDAEESDSTALRMSLETVKQRIMNMVPAKDNNQPKQLKSWEHAESNRRFR